MTAILEEKSARRSYDERSSWLLCSRLAGVERSSAADESLKAPLPGDQDQSGGAITIGPRQQAIRKNGQDRMTLITLKLPAKEVELLISLVSDQLFQREFIDPTISGFAEMSLGKKLVKRLRLLIDQGCVKRTLPSRRTGATD